MYPISRNLLLIAFVSVWALPVRAQLWYYDFMGNTATASGPLSTYTFFAPPEGSSVLQLADRTAVQTDPGSALGAGSELQLTAAAGSVPNKVGIANYPGGVTSYLKYELRFEGGSDGEWFFFSGNGTSFTGNGVIQPSEAMTGIRWTLSGGALTTSVISPGGWVPLATVAFTKNTNLLLEIFANNASEDLYYEKDGGYVASMGTADIWVNGVQVGDDLPKGSLPAETEIDSWMFYGTGNTTGGARLMLDNILYTNDMTMKIILPVRLSGMNARTEPIGVKLLWSAEGEEGSELYRIDRSGDGLRFAEVGRLPARKGAEKKQYTFLDATAGYGTYYYRLAVRTAGGKEVLGPVIRSDRGTGRQNLGAYPNPVTERSFRIETALLPAGSYTLTLSNSAAREQFRQALKGGSGTEVVQLPSGLAGGYYFLRITKGGETVLHQMLIVP